MESLILVLCRRNSMLDWEPKYWQVAEQEEQSAQSLVASASCNDIGVGLVALCNSRFEECCSKVVEQTWFRLI